jgi:hypothetical protein
MPPTSPEPASVRPPHPLAVELIEVLGAAEARVLDFASGSGRNARALRAAGFEVLEIPDAAATAATLNGTTGTFAAAIATHGLLHGTPESIGAAVEAIAARLAPAGLLYATFGSTRDARYGKGELVDPFVYAPLDGDERGVPHAFFDEARLRELLGTWFVLETPEDRDADEIAGGWAHTQAPLRSSAHWFVRARKLDTLRP